MKAHYKLEVPDPDVDNTRKRYNAEWTSDMIISFDQAEIACMSANQLSSVYRETNVRLALESIVSSSRYRSTADLTHECSVLCQQQHV